jgi:hypothetical protein
MFHFTAPGGKASLSIRSSNPDPTRRFSVSLSDGFAIGASGLLEMADQLAEFAMAADPSLVPEETPKELAPVANAKDVAAAEAVAGAKVEAAALADAAPKKPKKASKKSAAAEASE